MKKLTYGIVIGTTLLLTGCGALVEEENGQSSIVEDKWKTIKAISDREIIAELEQTVGETLARDEVAKRIIESAGEETQQEIEETVIQLIEAEIVVQGLGDAYGDLSQFEKHGILFIENKSQGAKQSGIWVGVKNPDDKLKKFTQALQLKVDAGEILAAPIFIFRSDYTQEDLYKLQDEVSIPLHKMHSGQGSYRLSVNVMTGHIEITHDFLTDEQQAKLREQFADHTIIFEQEGEMAAASGESILNYPAELFTTVPQTDGGFVIAADEERFLITGGKHGAVFFKYPGDIEQVKVGQRIEVEATGMILTSLPGQGVAKFVEVFPEYKPKTANLSESEVAKQAIVLGKEKFDEVITIKSITYEEKESKWHVVIIGRDEETAKFEIAD